MESQNGISIMLPPPEDEIFHHSDNEKEINPQAGYSGLEEMELPVTDLMGFDEAQVGPQSQQQHITTDNAVTEIPMPFHTTRINLGIEGIEATQGTQFYKSSRHLHAPHAEQDNSVPLIERKHLAIRIYPDLERPWWYRGGVVDGGVWFKRLDIADTYKTAFRLNGPISGRRATSIDRGNQSHTLNFRISDLYTRGRLLVYSRTWTDSFGSRKYSPWFGRIFTFTRVPDVRIRAHGIAYQRGTVSRPAPTLADFISTGVYLRKTYPMSRFNFVSYDVINFGGDLTDTSGGGCGAGWNALWNNLRARYFATGQDSNHYGLMQPGIPTAYGGCGGGNVGASFVGGGSIMAQELGHGLGRAHAPGCGAGGPDPNYPHYNHPSTASIGEFGMDYATGAIYNPANSNDFMGYCPNPWVSPYTYRALINGINNQPTPAGPSYVDAHTEHLHHTEQHLYLGFRVSCEGVVELQSGFTQQGKAGRSIGKATPHSLEVQNGKGEVIWAKQLTLEEAHQDHNDSHTNYFEAIPMVKEARKLIFNCDHASGPTVINIPKEAPKVHLKPLKIDKKKSLVGKMKLEWTVESQNGENLTSMVYYSNDGGKEYKPIAIGLEDNEFEVNLDQLPGGDDFKFRVLVSSILRSGIAETASFTVEKKEREAIISPIQDYNPTNDNSHIELAGCAYSPDGCAEEQDLKWFSNLDGYLGTGSHLIANDLKAGEHIITLVAPDGMGGETRAERRVRLIPLIK